MNYKKLIAAILLSVSLAFTPLLVQAGIQTTPGNNGTNTTISVTQATFGDVKYGYQTTDHGGWVKLDGRPSASLSATQRGVMLGLNLSAVPNVENRFITGASSLVALNALGGNVNGATIGIGNLPNSPITISGASAGTPSGSIDAQGAHTHSITAQFHDNTGGGFNGGRIQSTDRSPVRNQTNPTEIQMGSAGSHSHNFTGAQLPVHTHTATLGGFGLPLDVKPPFIAMNAFIYLGA